MSTRVHTWRSFSHERALCVCRPLSALQASLITDVAHALAANSSIELRPTSFRLSDEARTADGRSQHHADLLRRDPALFLERYGRHLSDGHFARIASASEELGEPPPCVLSSCELSNRFSSKGSAIVRIFELPMQNNTDA